MRILIFTTAFRPLIGGSELAIESVARRMSDVQFDILTPRYSRIVPVEEHSGNVSVYRLGFGSYFDKFIFPVIGFAAGLRMLVKTPYMAVHAYQASHAALAASLLRIVVSIPFILTLQEGNDLRRQPLPLRILRRAIIWRADYFTAISDYLAKYVLSVRKNAKVKIITNGVDFERFSDDDLKTHADIRTLFGVDPNQRIVMTVSRLVPKNGIGLLVRALRVVRMTFPAVLVIVGDGPLRIDLERLAKDNGMEKHVIFMGSVPNRDIPKYLAAADVFVRPSVSEGMGSAFLEAMAAGVPVIGTGVGGISDFLEHGKTGLLCDGGNPESVARKIVELFEQPALRDNIISNARQLVRDRYDWVKIAGQMRDLYNSLRTDTT